MDKSKRNGQKPKRNGPVVGNKKAPFFRGLIIHGDSVVQEQFKLDLGHCKGIDSLKSANPDFLKSSFFTIRPDGAYSPI